MIGIYEKGQCTGYIVSAMAWSSRHKARAQRLVKWLTEYGDGFGIAVDTSCEDSFRGPCIGG
jgi:hypothetical protein